MKKSGAKQRKFKQDGGSRKRRKTQKRRVGLRQKTVETDAKVFF